MQKFDSLKIVHMSTSIPMPISPGGHRAGPVPPVRLVRFWLYHFLVTNGQYCY